VDPKTDAVNSEYFQFARLTNMRLRKEIEEKHASSNIHTSLVEKWEPQPWMVQPNQTGKVSSSSSVEAVIVWKEQDFDAMMNDIRNQRVIAFDLEGNQSHSFLGKSSYIPSRTVKSC
jgi:hypothetical protein